MSRETKKEVSAVIWARGECGLDLDDGLEVMRCGWVLVMLKVTLLRRVVGERCQQWLQHQLLKPWASSFYRKPYKAMWTRSSPRTGVRLSPKALPKNSVIFPPEGSASCCWTEKWIGCEQGGSPAHLNSASSPCSLQWWGEKHYCVSCSVKNNI